MKKGKSIVLIGAVCAALCACLVHIIFSLSSPCSFFSAHWTAGELLSYMGTIALGLLALWQNKEIQRISEENEKRMEKIEANSNEIALKQMIVKYQMERLNTIRTCLDEYMGLVKPAKLIKKMSSDSDCERELYKEEITSKYRKAYNNICYEGKRGSELNQSLALVYKNVETVISCYDNTEEKSNSDFDVDNLTESLNELECATELFVDELMSEIENLVYFQHSMEEIREIYRNRFICE